MVSVEFLIVANDFLITVFLIIFFKFICIEEYSCPIILLIVIILVLNFPIHFDQTIILYKYLLMVNILK